MTATPWLEEAPPFGGGLVQWHALEGIAGGRIPDGATRLCDHAHGA